MLSLHISFWNFHSKTRILGWISNCKTYSLCWKLLINELYVSVSDPSNLSCLGYRRLGLRTGGYVCRREENPDYPTWSSIRRTGCWSCYTGLLYTCIRRWTNWSRELIGQLYTVLYFTWFYWTKQVLWYCFRNFYK